MDSIRRVSLKNLFLATFWFAAGAYVIGDYWREMAPIWEMERKGIWLCGPPQMNPFLAVPCYIAALSALLGRNRIAALFGVPTILAIAHAAWRASQP